MDKEDLKKRTKLLALRIIKLSRRLPNTPESRVISYQIIKSGTSIGANYRVACRARSRAEFIAKIGIVIEEADETAFWLEIIIESDIVKKDLLLPLFNEVNEIIAIMVASSNSAKNNI